MYIFIRRLPLGTSLLDLRRFVAEGLKPRWYNLEFVPTGKITSCKIFQVYQDSAPQIEYHGLVQVQPARTALELIDRINGKQLHSKQMMVRKYYRRSIDRDRRENQSSIAEANQDQRHSDRRRENLQFDPIPAGLTSPQQAVHSH